MAITIGLLACVKGKKIGHHKARDLYQSNLFKLGVEYLDLKTDDWYILSAKYGLVHQNQLITNYDESLNSKKIRKTGLEQECLVSTTTRIEEISLKLYFL